MHAVAVAPTVVVAAAVAAVVAAAGLTVVVAVEAAKLRFVAAVAGRPEPLDRWWWSAQHAFYTYSVAKQNGHSNRQKLMR